MGIEDIMFLALGFLAAGLLTIAITPAIVRRAVRLTRRRIEAATPMTLNEFRADKDKLRAEFAIATRRAELQRERLRDKIAAQAISFERATSEVSALRTERDEQFDAIRGLQNQLDEFKQTISDLNRDNRELAERVRQAESAYPAHSVGATLESGVDLETRFDPDTLSGHYDQDVEDLLMALGLERQRADLYRGQAQSLVARIDAAQDDASESDTSTETDPAPASSSSETSRALRPADTSLDLAQARIESAETHLSALLTSAGGTETDEAMLAEELSLADDLAAVHEKVETVQTRILAEYRTRRFAPAVLRGELEAIASSISAIVYAADSEDETQIDQSLFDRIRKFAGDTGAPANSDGDSPRGSAVSDRMAALREMRRT